MYEGVWLGGQGHRCTGIRRTEQQHTHAEGARWGQEAMICKFQPVDMCLSCVAAHAFRPHKQTQHQQPGRRTRWKERQAGSLLGDGSLGYSHAHEGTDTSRHALPRVSVPHHTLLVQLTETVLQPQWEAPLRNFTMKD